MSKLHVVLPALDEAGNIERVFSDLRNAAAEHPELEFSVILVDDGSTDGTGPLALQAAGELPTRVIRHETPQGPGRAFASAFVALAGVVGEADRILTLEADNTSRLELVGPMLRRLDDGEDVAFASPYMYGGGVVETTALRVALSHIANTSVKEMLGLSGLHTVSSFYRMYRGTAFLQLQRHFGPNIVERAGFECMVEAALKMVYLQLRITELPMVLDTSRRVGASKMRITRTILGYGALFRRREAWRRRATR
jgi:dolichol-phosphate mannosyltransferase